MRLYSLRLIILSIVAASLFLAVVLGGVNARSSAASFAQDLQDQNLRAMAFGFFSSVTASQGTWVTPEELAEFIPADVDQYFYKLLGPQGAYISGYNFVRVPVPIDSKPGVTHFATWTTGSGESYRGVSLSAYIEGGEHPGWITLQVAQSTRGAQALVAKQMRSYYRSAALIGIGMLLAAIIIVILIFQPLRRLAQAIQRRSADDLSPIRQIVPFEVQPLKDRLNLLFGLVREEQAAQKRLVANAAHQLRTPLTTIRIRSQLAKEAEDPIHHIEALDQAAVQAGVLAERLIALEKGREKTNLAPVALVPLFDELRAEWTSEFETAGVTLDVQMPTGPKPSVVAHPDVLKELIGNLLENALKHAKATRVKVSFDARTIRVEDDGIGIPIEDQPFVFERFYRSKSSITRGHGLGLSIVKEYAGLLGAKVSLTSRNGTCVAIRFSA